MEQIKLPSLDKQYLDTLKKILTNGEDKENRTGVKTKSIFCEMTRLDLREGLPLLSVRKVFPKKPFLELMMFLKGITDTNTILKQGVNFWIDNTSRDFLDSRGLDFLPVGEMGMGYGHQIRNFGGSHNKVRLFNTGDGIDQLDNLLNDLKNDPDSRRLIICMWNPKQLKYMALPPCHLYYQVILNKEKKELKAFLLMRSSDELLGYPNNVFQYSLLTYFLANYLGYEAKEFVHFAVDCHLYENQFEAAEKLITDIPISYSTPKLEILKKINSLDDLVNLDFKDLKITDYNPAPYIPVKMVK